MLGRWLQHFGATTFVYSLWCPFALDWRHYVPFENIPYPLSVSAGHPGMGYARSFVSFVGGFHYLHLLSKDGPGCRPSVAPAARSWVSQPQAAFGGARPARRSTLVPPTDCNLAAPQITCKRLIRDI